VTNNYYLIYRDGQTTQLLKFIEKQFYDWFIVAKYFICVLFINN